MGARRTGAVGWTAPGDNRTPDSRPSCQEAQQPPPRFAELHFFQPVSQEPARQVPQGELPGARDVRITIFRGVMDPQPGAVAEVGSIAAPEPQPLPEPQPAFIPAPPTQAPPPEPWPFPPQVPPHLPQQVPAPLHFPQHASPHFPQHGPIPIPHALPSRRITIFLG